MRRKKHKTNRSSDGKVRMTCFNCIFQKRPTIWRIFHTNFCLALHLRHPWPL